MSRGSLEMFLPAFMIATIGLVSVWSFLRRFKRLRIVPWKTTGVNRINAIGAGYKVLLLISCVIACVYAYYPEYYEFMMPIDSLDHPLVNTIGVLILKVSLVWIVVAQLSIDKIFFEINSGMEDWGYQKLVLHSQKLLFSGLSIMFFGFFVTISSLATIIISVVGICLFERLLRT